MKKIGEYIALNFLIVCITCCVLGLIICVRNCNKSTSTSSTPVENIRIDSLKKENDILIIEVNNLDSIKDAKVIEVKELDNDSTIKLFYELIRK